jgi:hypothetical protein
MSWNYLPCYEVGVRAVGMRLLDEAVETHDEEFLNDVYREAKLLPCASYGTI